MRKDKFIRAWMVFLVLLLSGFAYGEISTNKDVYDIDEVVSIYVELDSYENIELSIISGQDQYSLMGIPDKVINFSPRKPGNYSVKLLDIISLKIIEETRFNVGIQTSVQRIRIITDKEDYEFGEIIRISFDKEIKEEYRIVVSSSKDSYWFLGSPGEEIEFVPKEPGNYSIQIFDEDGNNIGSKEVGVIGKIKLPTKVIRLPEEISTDKADYTFGDKVIIKFKNLIGKDYELSIKSNTSEYKYDWNGISNVTFTPKSVGSYKIDLLKDREIVDSAFFIINEKEKKAEKDRDKDSNKQVKKFSRTEILNKFTVQNSKKEKEEEIRLKFYKDKKEVTDILDNESYSAELDVSKDNIKKILFKGVKIKENKTSVIGIDDVSSGKVKIKKAMGKKVMNSFAIDPTGLEFSNATVTVKAAGTELWKCKEWNFSTRSCYGEWIKLMDVVPGKDYEIFLTPEDPGYAETGVASINSKKPIYHPGETAELIMVVLDTEGHLVSNATVYLDITSPNSQTYSYSTVNNEIIETEGGIYTSNFSDTDIEGNYSLIVSAYGKDVNSTLISYFTVKEYYEFDILRDVPVTIDPWHGPFNSSIKIISYTDASVFDFSEVLPINFTIDQFGGASLTYQDDKKILTWTSLKNNSIVSYTANSPLVTPDLYELGESYVRYGSNIFYEARPWYLAIDPITISDDQGSNLQVSSTTLNEGDTFTVTVQMDAVRSGKKVQASGNVYLQEGTHTGAGDQSSTVITTTCGTGDNFKITGRSYNCPAMTCQAAANAWEIYVAEDDGATDQQITFTVEVCEDANLASPYDIGVRATQLEATVTFDDYRDNIVVNAPVNNAPVITLTEPGTGTTVTSIPIDFNFTVTDVQEDTLDNCTLWTNFSGTWKKNHTLFNIPDGEETNFTKQPDDGHYKWNVECYDSKGLGNFSASNYTVTVAAPPDITGTVSSDEPKKEGETITFTGACTNPGDQFRLIVCNSSAATCDTTTPSEEIICQGTDSDDMTPSCSLLTDSSYAGTHTNDKATCCDDGGLCDSTTVSVEEWTIYGAPVILEDASDQGSSSDTPTTAGENVKFNISATDPNDDQYKIVVCDTNKTIGGTCNETIICSSGFVNSGDEASCTHNTIGEAGSYNWWAFACDDAINPDDILCSHWNNGTSGTTKASPYQVNNKPQVTNISANVSYAKSDDNVLMYTVDALDIDGNDLKIQCGDTSGVYNLCESSFGAGERECTFTSTWTDNIGHEIFCVVNDSYTLSDENVTNVTADNMNPKLFSPFVNDSDKFVRKTDTIRLNVTAQDIGSGVDNVSVLNGNIVYMSKIIGKYVWEVVTTANDLGCSEVDGNCTMQFIARDLVGNHNDTLYFNLTIDHLSPNVDSFEMNDSDKIVRSSDNFSINITVSDTNNIINVTLQNESNVQMYKIDGTNKWTVNTSASELGCTANDGICNLTFIATDVVGNINNTETYGIKVDDVNPSVYSFEVNDSDKIVRSSDNFSINITVADTNNIINVTVQNESNVQMYAITGTNKWTVNTSANDLGCTAKDGICNLTFIAIDIVGNVNGTETYGIKADDINPSVTNPKINDSDKIVYSSQIFSLNITVTDTNNIVNVTVQNETNVQMYQTGDTDIWTVNTSASNLGCTDNDGICNLTFTATDIAGNINESVVFGIKIDNLNPNVYNPEINDTDKIVKSLDVFSLNITVTDTSNIANVTVENQSNVQMYQIYGTNKWTVNTSADNLGCTANDGICNLTFIATDIVGNLNDTTVLGIKLDDIPPLVFNQDTNDTDNIVRSDDSINISVEVSDTSGALKVTVKGNPMTQLGDIWYYIDTPDNMGCGEGICELNFIATDILGNINSSEILNITIDDTKPKISLNYPEDSYETESDDIELNFTVTDNINTNLTCNVIINGTVNNTGYIYAANGSVTNFSVSQFNEGTYYWNVTCWDNIPNTNTSETREFTIDLNPPIVKLENPINNTLEEDSNTITFQYNVSDSATEIKNCSLIINDEINGEPDTSIQEETTSSFVRVLGNGQYNWSVNCTDNVGRIGQSETYNLTINIGEDTTPPLISLISPTIDQYLSNNTVVLIYQPEDISGFLNCSLYIDGRYNQTNTTIITDGGYNNFSINISEGLHNWTINCTDNSNNKNAGNSSIQNFTVDITNPGAFNLVSPSNGTINSDTTPLLTWQQTNEINFYRYHIEIDDNINFGSIDYNYYTYDITSTSYTATVGPDTSWYWRVNAIDKAGNNHKSEWYNYTTDNTNPSVTLNSPDNNSWSDNKLNSFSYTASDNFLKNCTLYGNFSGTWSRNESDNNPNNGAEDSFIDINLKDGVYLWNVLCEDNASNKRWDEENNTLYIDTTGPDVNLNSPITGYNSSSSTVNFNFQVTDNLAKTLSCNLTLDGAVNETGLNVNNDQSYGINVEGLNEGNHTWNVTCKDQSNNTKTSETRIFTVDLNSPVVRLESPNNQTSLDTPQSVAFTYNVSDTATDIINCSLYINEKYNQSNTNNPKDTSLSFTEYISGGDYNWSVNCKDSVGRTGYSGYFELTVQPPVFINVRSDYGEAIDRDKVKGNVQDNTTLIVHLSDGSSGKTVKFYANITDPNIDQQKEILLGEILSNSTGYAVLNFSGRSSVGNKVFAGNYTWWAESGIYTVNTTSTVLIFGGLNISFRFSDELPDLLYGPSDIAKVQEFLKSFGPESDREVNSTYLAEVNTTFTLENGTNYTIELIDPDLWEESTEEISGVEEENLILKKSFSSEMLYSSNYGKISYPKENMKPTIETTYEKEQENIIIRFIKWVKGFIERLLFFKPPEILPDTEEDTKDNTINKPILEASRNIKEFLDIITQKNNSKESINQIKDNNQELKDITEKKWYTKKKEDKNFDVHIIDKRFVNDNLIINFYHDSDKEQPISVRGKINYSLSKEFSNKDYIIELIVYDYQNEYFELKVGRFSEIIAFQEVDTVRPKLASNKTDFSLDDAAEFGLNLTIQDEKDEEEIVVTVYDADNKKVEIDSKIDQNGDGEFVITLNKSREFKPGKYSLEVEIIADGTKYIKEQDFSWGVLAVNTHKSIYLPNEDAFIGIAVLDDYGAMVCNASVELKIISPDGIETVLSTSNGLVKISPECEIYAVTNLPDYYTNYGVSATGTYKINLTTETYNGRRSLQDYFVVKEEVDFDVTRDGPTRIYPLVPYVMNINITANKDYNGPIIERVPSSFKITPQDGLEIGPIEDTKILRWDKELLEGETYNIYYEFDAPDISPYLFLLGELEIGGFSEERKWFIASDLVEQMDVATVSCIELGASKVCQVSEVTADDIFYAGTSLAVESDRYGQVTAEHTNTDVPAGATIDDVEVCLKWYVSDAIGTTCTISVYNGAWNTISSTCQGTEQLYCYDASAYFSTVEQTKDIRSRVYYLGDHPSQDDYLYVNWMYVNVTYTPAAPNITLIEPASYSTVTKTPINFNFTVTDHFDETLQNCTLWANFSSIWEENKTIFDIANGTKTNINASPDDGHYRWNVLCYNSYDMKNESSSNYTVTVAAPPDIQTNVENNGSVNEGQDILFWAECSNPGDRFRLIVCNSSAATCDSSTPKEDIICNGTFSTSENATCKLRTNSNMSGTNTGDKATCCDDGGLCDSTIVSVDDWTVLGAPVITKGPSDHESDVSSPTQAGEKVNFTVTATDPNSDNYRLYVCNVTSATFAGCQGGSVNELCSDTNNPSGSSVSCDFSLTQGLSGNYSWWAFACKESSPYLCSAAINGTGINASPFYINNKPAMLNITSNRYLAKSGDPITITSVSASDTENDLLKLQCGNESGKYNLCDGDIGAGERSCGFVFPWDDDNAHTIYCVLNDSFSTSLFNETIIIADNSAPIIKLDAPQNDTFDTDGNIVFRHTPKDPNLEVCQLWGNWTPTGWGINQTNITPKSNEINSFIPVNLDDGHYLWNVWCNDSIGLSSFNSTNYTIKVDTKGPEIILHYPRETDNPWDTTVTVDFEYEVYDEGTDINTCYLVINGTKNETDPDGIIESDPNELIQEELIDGDYSWSINCTDTNGHTTNSTTRFLQVRVANNPPKVTLNNPSESSYLNYNGVTFLYYVEDDKGMKNCSLYLDGELNRTNTSITIDSYNNFTVTGLNEGKHNWTTLCYDDIEQDDMPSTFMFYIDTLSPTANLISPANNTEYKKSDRINFRYNVTDSFGEEMKNCSLYINDIFSEPEQNNVNLNSTQEFLRTLSNQDLYWYIECYDKAGNRDISATFNLTVNSSLKIWNGSIGLNDKPEGVYKVDTNAIARWFYPVNLTDSRNLTLDKSPPNISLGHPEDGYNTTNRTIKFTYNATDKYSNITECNLIIDDENVMKNYSIADHYNNFTYQLDYGQHNWSVNCTDEVGNIGDSSIRNITIRYKEIIVESSDIVFSNYYPVENERVEINATIYNIGDEDITENFYVRFRSFDYTGSVNIIDDIVVNGLNKGENITLNTTSRFIIGNYTITVFADLGDDVFERNESNNLANNSLFISSYQTYYGDIESEILLDTSLNFSVYSWKNDTSYKGNVFAADSDSLIMWSSLTALSRNISNDLRIEDFIESDNALNITNLTDSLNKTYTFQGSIKETDTFNVFNSEIDNVPIVNSTNYSNFVTGVLWDSSDFSGSENYNGSQDLVFISEINMKKQGMYGVYDYELKVPAFLRRYIKPNNDNTITFYIELT